MNSTDLKNSIIDILDSKKALDIEEIPIAEKSPIADYFVIASGTSSTQIKSLVETLEEEVSKNFSIKPKRVEGARNANWIVIDYGDVIVHIFSVETRKLYSLEDLWRGADHSAL
jgi:ribosome-associated protein